MRPDTPCGNVHLARASISREDLRSFIHHAINDLLQEKKARLHSPADYERHYDVILPFKEDW